MLAVGVLAVGMLVAGMLVCWYQVFSTKQLIPDT